MVQEQRTIVEEQPTAVTEPVSPVAADGDAAVADAVNQAVADFDLSTPAGIKAAAEKFPALKNWREEGYGAGLEAGKQRTIQELQRDQASSERVQATAKQIYERYGIELDEQDQKTLTGLTRANADAARLEAMRNLALEAKGMAATETEAELLQGLIDKASGNADEMQQVATMAISAVANRSKTDAINSLDLDQLLNDEKHRSAIEARVAAGVQAELEARGVEAQQRENPPEAPVGAGGVAGRMTAERLAGMTPAARLEYLSSLDDEARGDMWSVVLGQTG